MKMKTKKILHVFLIVGLLSLGDCIDIGVEGVDAESISETSVVRSNHNAQINVPAPSNTYINTYSGNLFHPVYILRTPGRGGSIEMFMSYNSGWHDFAGHYGHGWQLSYNIFYTRVESGDVIVVWGNGRADKFIKSNGSFLPPVDTYNTFQEYQPGKYVLQTRDGLKYYFDSPVHKRVTKMQDPNGNVLNFTYNSDMLLTTITDASGRQVKLDYADGRLTNITDFNITPARSVQFQYDVNNNLISIIDPLGNTMNYGYDSDHYLTGITDALGNMATITYFDGSVVGVTDEFITRSFSYDLGNGTTTMTDTLEHYNQTTHFVYDSEGRITAVEDPLGNYSTMVWDENNNLIAFTDEDSNTTAYTYDSMGNLLTVTDAENHTTTYTYGGAFNKLMSITNANGDITTYDYDSHGNLVKATYPLSHTTTYGYNEFGYTANKTDANGFTTTYEYDNHGNLISYLDSTFTYDNAGNMLSMNNSNVGVEYEYDALNRVTRVNYVSFGKSINYTYDDVGNRIGMTDPDGGVTSYTYDEANRLTILTNPLGQTTNYTYDSISRPIRKDYHNGVYAMYTYDEANRLLSLTNKNSSGEILSSYTYEYDAYGNRISMTENNGDKTAYTYDNLYQLTSVTYTDNSTINYTYDAYGNRLTLTNATEVTNYTYDDEDRLLSAGMVIYGWDNNGNLISKTDEAGTTNYTYDHQNRLISITFLDGSTNTFTYYPDGRRLSKTDTSGETIYYFYDGFNVIVESNSAGDTLARYTSAGIDDWISMDRDGLSYYYQKDALGSVSGLTNSSGAVVATYDYDVFGSIINQTGDVVNPYTFTGREYESESDLYYYRTRYYDADVGRFNTKDLLAGKVYNPLSMNRYSYVQNNPAIFVDPHGTLAWWIPIVIKIVIVIIELALPDELDDDTKELSPTPTPTQPPILYVPMLMGDGITTSASNPVITPPSPPPSSGTYQGVDGTAKTGGGGGGGIESMPLMNIEPSYFYTLSNLSNSNKAPAPIAKTKILKNGGSTFSLVSESSESTRSMQVQSDPLVNITDIIPTEGPAGTEAVSFVPSGPFDVGSNAVDAAAVDFIDSETSLNKATVFATKTIDITYDHDYVICNRFHDYTLETAAAVPLPDIISGTTDTPWFWYVSMTKDKLVEEGFIFVVFVDEDAKTFTVDSHLLTHQYPTSENHSYDYVFNFQIWSSSSEEAYFLLRRALENLSEFDQGWTVTFANTAEPDAPTVLIESAELAGNTVRMSVQSWLKQAQTVNFSGFVRYSSDREGNVPFTYNVTLEPGFNIVELPLGNILDGVIDIQINNFFDKVYVGSGVWFSFEDSAVGGNSSVTLDLPNCSQVADQISNEYPLSGCADITGNIGTNGWGGVTRTLNPNDLPIDVSKYPALTFFARGDGKSYRVSIETKAVRQLNSSDFHQFVFTTSSEWRQFIIPLSSFSQRWEITNLVTFTGEDVISVAWSSVGDPIESINLSVDRVAFISSTVINTTAVLHDTRNTTCPYTVTTQVTDDAIISDVYLFYSLDAGHTFINVSMAASDNTFSASVPGQPLGTEVRYYIEATDATGNVATDPVDIPYTTYRFQINEHPYLLVDDFADTNPVNILGGNSGPFGEDSGSSILVYHEGGYIRLGYNVSAANSYAGYYSLLKQANLTTYNAVSFMVKGSAGGEIARVGLRDESLNETKIVIGEYLPDGITTSWQKVTIPLTAFTRVTGWSSMDNFNVNFENRISSGAGTIYLDDIKFEYIPHIPIVVDNFNDMVGENGLSGSLWTSTGGGATINTSYDQENAYGDTGTGYRISYSGVTGTAWAGSGTDLMWLDASCYDTLSFYIKGSIGGEKPNIYLSDGFIRKFVDIEDYVPVTSFWQKVVIPLEDFEVQGVNITNLSYFQIVWEWQEMNGTIYLDDIEFDGRNHLCNGSECAQIFIYIIQLSQGWNLISTPLQPEDTSLWDVLAPIQGRYDKIFTYEGGWSYSAYYGGIWYGGLTDMVPGRGYWIHMKGAENLTLVGYIPDKNISLNQGWNLIGWSSNETIHVFEALTSINNSYDKIFTYEGGWSYSAYYGGIWYGGLTDIVPGRGYWIHMKEARVLQVP
ncbi:MAG: hypothetical protein A7315_05765 [Candidatus Altiarchaeales archaeon WOR_SM1_79]|nr:MAG: hypothetical protein A7315_05765 [Candidatus Altiarchaeales archaeon WOR_SM1_79]